MNRSEASMVATCRLNAHDLEVDPAELDRRRAAWRRPDPRYTRGALAKYAALVGRADESAVCG